MTLPQKCPLGNTDGCRGRDCHLYHIDWRTGEENCSIGYRYTHKTKGSSHTIEDTYARDVKLRKMEAARKRTEVVEETAKDTSNSNIDEEPPVSKEGEKTSKLDSLMDELPENYEEEFWANES
ncbi:hypothetical protein [Methanohalophilus sp.]|uniref:hypothetical protein n=1 Tax=Methanohalophilus sp. TaxID=1966352 RepID=UPI002611ED57|nr:hypothetical protein [Methanohalophilus sp.]MDK2892981.1 hypothetical protein [Methanohalophilus sp.]